MNHSAQPYQFGIDFSTVPSIPENAADLPAYYTSFKNLLKLERDKIKQFHRAGAGGREVVQAHTSLIDAVLRHIISSLASREKSPAPEALLEEFALIAVGGYGRGELNPFSDIDLLFLRPKNIRRTTDLLIQDAIPTFWGMGLEVGQSCRTLRECLDLAEQELTIKTSMIETRFLIGDSSKYEKFSQSIEKNILRKNIKEFIDAKAREKALRYEEGIGPGSNPEPNIKEGAGGLRDYHSALWAVAVRFGCLSFREIPRTDIISAEPASRSRRIGHRDKSAAGPLNRAVLVSAPLRHPTRWSPVDEHVPTLWPPRDPTPCR
ncbi:MAG: nucleotidyltransferase domain-containing protein, partial [Nitrospinae bacterium]|nr:nucleotidyltransferase domain-containing protein [Nitrospinota bacterium]